MKKYYLSIVALCFIFSNSMSAQILNKEIEKTDPRLKEKPFGVNSADDILNGKIKWSNLWRVDLVYDDEGFDKSKLKEVPSKGIHPRLFTSPKEYENIKNRLENTHIGRMMLKIANDKTAEMRNGEGAWGDIYKILLKRVISPKDAESMKWNYTNSVGWNFVNQLTVQGLLAQIYGNKELLKETSTVSANYIKSISMYLDVLPDISGFESEPKQPLYWGGYLAKLYDFTATGMNDYDKQFFVDYIKNQTSGKYCYGMNLPAHWCRWNHIAFSLSYPMTVLSVDYASGIDKRILKRGVDMAENYYTYQYSPEGMSTEGLNYSLGHSVFNFSYLIAIARRGEKNILTHPHVKAMSDWFIQTLSPNPKALWYTGGDTGSISMLPWVLVMTMKYFYPDDAKLDYLLANSIPEKLNESPDVLAYICCNDPIKSSEQYNGKPDCDLPLTYFAKDRGLFITRNKWDKNAFKFSMEARTDTYFLSHDHSDRGHFSLSAYGREWVIDGFRSTESKYHSVISIDGRGQGYFATPASWLSFIDNDKVTLAVIDNKYCYDWMWLKTPVADMLLNKKVSEKWDTGVYRDVAEKLKKYYPGIKPERDPLENVVKYYSGNLKGNPLIWHEDTWPMRMPNNPVKYSYRTAGMVKGKHNYAIIVDDILKDENEHLYDWVMPMPLDIEVVSIKQIADVTMQTGALNLGFNQISDHRSGGEFDILLGDKRMNRDMREVDDKEGGFYRAGMYKPSEGNPMLLVRVLDKKPSPRPNLEVNPRLETMEHLKTEDMHQFYLRSMGIGKRLVVSARCEGDPSLKVLLFPHIHGDELPYTKWNDDRTRLTVKWSDQTDIFTFIKGDDGRTRIKIESDNQISFDLK